MNGIFRLESVTLRCWCWVRKNTGPASRQRVRTWALQLDLSLSLLCSTVVFGSVKKKIIIINKKKTHQGSRTDPVTPITHLSERSERAELSLRLYPENKRVPFPLPAAVLAIRLRTMRGRPTALENTNTCMKQKKQKNKNTTTALLTRIFRLHGRPSTLAGTKYAGPRCDPQQFALLYCSCSKCSTHNHGNTTEKQRPTQRTGESQGLKRCRAQDGYIGGLAYVQTSKPCFHRW